MAELLVCYPVVVSTFDLDKMVRGLKLGKDYRVEKRRNGSYYIVRAEVRVVVAIDDIRTDVDVVEWDPTMCAYAWPRADWALRIESYMENAVIMLRKPSFVSDWRAEDARANP